MPVPDLTSMRGSVKLTKIMAIHHTNRRVVVPEVLDSLPAGDPSAIRSRRDLRRINFLMGNFSWIMAVLEKHASSMERGVVELGAGDGRLLNRMADRFPAARFTTYDLAPPPDDLSDRIEWLQGDLFESPAPENGGVLFANLFLHHFENPALALLGRWCDTFDVLAFCEPDRARLPHLLGKIMHPFINHVTRHDMHVSIDAGFAEGELAAALGLSSVHWKIRESTTLRGARRFLATRRNVSEIT